MSVESDCPYGHLAGFERQVESLREIGRFFFGRGWSTGTSSNYSCVVSRSPLEILITASGMDKGNLGPGDFVRVDSSARPVIDGQPKCSAETWLHVVAATRPGIGAVLHTHSIWGTLLSDVYFDDGGFWIEGYEMLKGLAGITTHQHRQWIPIYENTQDIQALAAAIRPEFAAPSHPPFHGFLMQRHGLYTWGADLAEARRHIEILEFLFESVGRRRQWEAGRLP
jgi:methylthioribulose-1-phosphate dehydratase